MIIQTISPDRSIFFAGETVCFTLSGIPEEISGRAVVRTNIGGAVRHRTELIERTELNRIPRNSDWQDVEMLPGELPGEYRITLPLPEIGVFEAKCCFLPDGSVNPLWPLSDNFRLKVEPAVNAAGNGIYCAFVRQWNDQKHLPHSPALPDLAEYDRKGFVVVPPSGTFRDLIGHLDHIFGTLNCRILQLLPIHPVPMAYGRMGRYGSPFAATDYFAVDPALAEFDESATPMEQFEELIDAVHSRRGRIFMDIPVNHTGWASKLQCEHPDYFVRSPEDRRFESPGAWGIVWADLCRLDYDREKVHELMAKVFLFWCRRGVDGFRCDAGYMVPRQAWDYIVSQVRREYPDTVFLLEGLGGPLTVQEQLLAKSNLNWGYSELFQNYTRDEISSYYPYMNDTGNRIGTLANFAETHDNDRLAAKGKRYARSRFLVTALLSQHGTFGFANGAEFYATEKIDVHGCGALNFGAPDNLNTIIGKLNTLLGSHPAFGIGVDVKLIQHGGGNCIAAIRRGKNIPQLLVLVNLDCSTPVKVSFSDTGHSGGIDLLSGRQIFFEQNRDLQCCTLEPGDGYCISFDGFTLPENRSGQYALPPQVQKQCAAAMAQKLAMKFGSLAEAAKADGMFMLEDPLAFMEELSGISPAPVTVFRYPEDCRRQVMIPPGDVLLIKSKEAFTFDIVDDKITLRHNFSLPGTGKNGERFALTTLPENDTATPHRLKIKFTSFSAAGSRRAEGTIILLAPGEKRHIRMTHKWHEAGKHTVFGSNDLGGYAMFNAAWGTLQSKYNAMLAANINREYPCDRHVMFSCCRAWLIVDEYSQELDVATLEEYTIHPANRATMHFSVPDGHGGMQKLNIDFYMKPDADTVFFRFALPDDRKKRNRSVRLVLRPDLEDRINHTVTRACDGAEHLFRHSITACPGGFDFQPSSRRLSLRVSRGEFRSAPEWRYMVDLPAERYYGLPDKTDLFSPGYFEIELSPGENVILAAHARSAFEAALPEDMLLPPECENFFHPLPPMQKPEQLALPALSRFVVKRDGLSSVIAGYPWFLDWGRDTLIALRGLVKFPEFREQSAQILRRFAAFERNGTIPNMICGGNDSNRETSDAPLYLIIATRDYIAASGDREFLETDCGGRKMKTILCSIIDHYKRGTGNGIVMDANSKLIFSPSHFSWMDTNYPAGTPREGYPIEIQSLWYAALKFIGDDETAAAVGNSIEKYFFSNGRISDCLHCRGFVPADTAQPDDHIRCNMLTAITLGAVKKRELQLRIIHAAETLLIPGAIRTLDDAETTFQLPVVHHGVLLNDPSRPYMGYYRGPEDTSRKAAYHNGTAWCWPFPAFCESLYLAGGESSRRRALALLLSCAAHFENGIIGELPEVLDGDAPHRNGGCPAQAWSVSEFYRVLNILEAK